MGQAAAISMRPTQLILHLILLKPNIGVGPCGPFWGLNTAGGMTDRGRLYVTPPTEEKGQLWHRGKGPRALVDKAKLAYCEAEGSDSQPRARQEEVQTTSGTAIRSELKITKKKYIYISSHLPLEVFKFTDIGGLEISVWYYEALMLTISTEDDFFGIQYFQLFLEKQLAAEFLCKM